MMKRWVDSRTVVLGDDDFSTIVVEPVQRPPKRQRTDDERPLLNLPQAGSSLDNAIVLSPTPSVKDDEEMKDEELAQDSARMDETHQSKVARNDSEQDELEIKQLEQDELQRNQENPERVPHRLRAGSVITPPDTSPEPESVVPGEVTDNGSQKAGKRRFRQLGHFSNTGPAFPRSAYQGYKPPLKPVSEVEAREQLHGPHNYGPSTFILDHFSIYMANGRRVSELVTLEKLLQRNYAEFCFDGVLSAGDKKCYLQGVPFEVMAIDGYGDLEFKDFTGNISIKSNYQSKWRNMADWYQLGLPAPEYRRFYKPFLWLARFCKYYVDYLLNIPRVSLAHFRRRFFKWLSVMHSGDTGFEQWLAEAGLDDFRTTIAANVSFLWKECYGLDEPGLCRHPIWGEVDPYSLTAIPTEPNNERRTIVTPFVYQCFRGMYFGDQLEARSITDPVALQKSDELKAFLKLTPRSDTEGAFEQSMQVMTPISMSGSNSRSVSQDFDASTIVKGDVVCVTPDATTPWRSKAHAWYAYVQDVRKRSDRTSLEVLWLYEPHDTTLGKAHYPFHNELFLSDNCSCGKAALDLDCVMRRVEVAWCAKDPHKEQGLFVRQKFRTVHDQDMYDFVTLQLSDFSCQCRNDISIFDDTLSKYTIGDTVLVREWNQDLGEDRLQPAQIVGFDHRKRRVFLRQLLRKSEQLPVDKPKPKPNELVLTDTVFDKACDKIVRKCNVRVFDQAEIDSGEIVTPYDRDGAGDFFYIARRELSEAQREFPPITEGWNPSAHPHDELIGMSLFCGGGTFDRGLEEAGAAKFKYAVDWNEHALHSHRANVRRPENMDYFLGSVNDLLARAMAGDTSSNVAQPRDINMIAGGSPCPGFSMLQLYKLSEESKQMASLVASVVSFVDFYAPKYFLLENVVSMTMGMGPNKDENVFAQIVSALVGLGYQVQQFLGDAWSHGSPQQRSRVFIIASAPGLPPLSPIAHSHSHPNNEFRTRKLGLSSNGLPFGNRRDDFTAFQHVTPEQATADLANIGDSQPQLCTQFPDHRTISLESATSRTRMAAVPVRPYGMGLIQAKRAGLLRGEPSDYCDRVNSVRQKENSRMYSRIVPTGLFPTIVTKTAVGDGINGRVVHWSQHRIITVMEARRAQGYPDWEVLVGTPSQQMRIVGNSVDRKVALVLGLSLRESWEQARSSSTLSTASGASDENTAKEQEEKTADRTASGAYDEDITKEQEEKTADEEAEAMSDAAVQSVATDTASSIGVESMTGAQDDEQRAQSSSSGQARPGMDFTADEIDNRTAKILLFMPEALDEIREALWS